jgi:formylglycine-generating enzyme required for sulfatase activity
MRKRIVLAAVVIVGATVAAIWLGRPVKPPAQPLILDLGSTATTQPATLPSLDVGPKVTMKLVPIPTGKFIMGSLDKEPGRQKSEAQHEVLMSKPYYMGATHVSVDQFAVFVKDTGYQTEAEKEGTSAGFELKYGRLDLVEHLPGCSWRSPCFEQNGDHPVVQVSWNDATAFCDWLSKKSGKTVTLPTEAQWEYACRAGTKTAYPWGNGPDLGVGWDNCADQALKKALPNSPAEAALFSWDDGFAFTSPVGNFKANLFGLYDMNGNVLQWCQDRYGDYPSRVALNPTGAESGKLRVVRGGSWFNPPVFCRSASRLKLDPSARFGDLGFRVVVTGTD